MIYLHANVPMDRNQPGEIVLVGSKIDGDLPWPARFRSDKLKAKENGNSARNPLYPFGDFPTGLYAVTIGPQRDGYGPHRRLNLRPLNGTLHRFRHCGDAWMAREAEYLPFKPRRSNIHPNDGKRWALQMHGGRLNMFDGSLRPTYGCIRVHDESMKKILEAVEEHGITRLLATQGL